MKLSDHPSQEELAFLLGQEDFSDVFKQADAVRREAVGDIIHIRSILEFSNYCRRQCRYCGINCNNSRIGRYRMMPEEIIATAKQAYEAGYKTIVLQSGEDPFYTPSLLGEIVSEIKKTGIIVTLSCGEMCFEDYQYLRRCGADRYLLKHETSDPDIYASLHPCGTLENRIRCLKDIKALGYETGSGFMIGLPGQTEKTISADLFLLRELACDMAGIGPFIPHPDTELRDQPAGSTQLTKRAVALARLLMPTLLLPATTALGVLSSREKENIFSCGANVVMRKVTPDTFKSLYELYPSHLGQTHILSQRKELEEEIKSLGKIPL